MLASTGRRYLLSIANAPYAAALQLKDLGIGPPRESHHAGTSHGCHWLFSTSAASAADDRTPYTQQQQQQQQENAAPGGQLPDPQQQIAASSQQHTQQPLNSTQQSPPRNTGFRKVDPALFGGRYKPQQTRREGIVHVLSTMNNTHLVLTDRDSKVQTWVSGGTIGYKNANKATPMAAELAAKELARRAKDKGFHAVVVKLKGAGKNKQFAVQSLAASGLTVTQIWDVTPIPYNGCRLPKRRRV